MRRILTFLLLAAVATPATVAAHCEVPCGIYGDAMRIEMLNEHITTIEKAASQIRALSAEDEPDYNQLVRWVSNKEKHAEEFQEIVSQYFLHQRLKPSGVDDAAYVHKLTLLHQMLVTAMKCKQTTDNEPATQLRDLVEAFAVAYFSPEELEHIHEHRD